MAAIAVCEAHCTSRLTQALNLSAPYNPYEDSTLQVWTDGTKLKMDSCEHPLLPLLIQIQGEKLENILNSAATNFKKKNLLLELIFSLFVLLKRHMEEKRII